VLPFYSSQSLVAQRPDYKLLLVPTSVTLDSGNTDLEKVLMKTQKRKRLGAVTICRFSRPRNLRVGGRMKSRACPNGVVLAVCLIGLTVSTEASVRETILPAGTILQCTLNEPNFSSATVEVGDPVLCHLREVSAFGQPAFPRGSYLVGHLESAKDPGHFVGKGNLKLQFDRIGVPGADVPLDAKVIAVRGYKVDKEGTIHGKGHAKRDIVEWMLPPLWPWKVIMLPARGPRPKLKAETVLNLRLMDDVQLPQIAQDYGPEWHSFSRPQSQSFREPFHASTHNVPGIRCSGCSSDGSTPLATTKASYAAQVLQPAPTPAANFAPGVALFIMKSGVVLAVSDYILENGHIAYTLVGGGGGIVGFDEVDWNPTISVNAERGVGIVLRSGQTSLSPQGDSSLLLPSTDDGNRPLTVIVLKDGGAYVTRTYWVDGWRMHCIGNNGEEKLFALDRIDLGQTVHLNRERHVKFILQSGVRAAE
jgi:hypothetical protein